MINIYNILLIMLFENKLEMIDAQLYIARNFFKWDDINQKRKWDVEFLLNILLNKFNAEAANKGCLKRSQASRVLVKGGSLGNELCR
jgi:hypothetical protein